MIAESIEVRSPWKSIEDFRQRRFIIQSSLICDTQIAEVTHPYVPLPSFPVPADASHQLHTAREYMDNRIGLRPVCGHLRVRSQTKRFHLAAEARFQWFRATTVCSAGTCLSVGDPPNPICGSKASVGSSGIFRR